MPLLVVWSMGKKMPTGTTLGAAAGSVAALPHRKRGGVVPNKSPSDCRDSSAWSILSFCPFPLAYATNSIAQGILDRRTGVCPPSKNADLYLSFCSNMPIYILTCCSRSLRSGVGVLSRLLKVWAWFTDFRSGTAYTFSMLNRAYVRA